MRKRRKKPTSSAQSQSESRQDKNESKVSGPLNSLNDISWYSRYPDLLAAGASFPYPYRPGMFTGEVLETTVGSANLTTIHERIGIPGIMAIDWYPSLGVSQSVTDPASLVAKELFARVRAAFSGTLVADPPDFVIYLMALDSVFSYLGWLKRVYRSVSTYTPNNRLLPEGILLTMGFSNTQIAEMQKDKMRLFSSINELIKMSRKFHCPAVMDIFNRHYWMGDNVYADAPSANSQFYIFNQCGWYKFAMLDTPDNVLAGGLTMVSPNLSSSGSVIDILYQFGLQLISALSSSDDAYTISGYLMRAFEGTPTFNVSDLEYGEVLEPVYVEEVLSQIENSTAIPARAGAIDNRVTFQCDVTQDPKRNTILSKPQITIVDPQAKNYVKFKQPMLSIRSDTPTAADNVIASRLKASYILNFDAGSENTTVIVDCASEFVTQYRITTYFQDETAQYMWNVQPLGGIVMLSSGDWGKPLDYGWGQFLALITQFDWHPLMPYVYAQGESSGNSIIHCQVFGDLHNTTFISDDQMKQLNRICLLSEFNAFSV